MKVNLKLESGLRIVGTNASGKETYFDSLPEFGGAGSAPTPMEIMLEAMCACSFMDVVSILRKKRIEITKLEIHSEGERATTNPKVFETAHIIYELTSPNAELKDLERAVELSHATYCGASAMFRRAGCNVTWESVLKQ
jgi:putative redox protein